MKKFLPIPIIFLLLFSLACNSQNKGEEVIIEIPKGAGLSKITRILHEKEILTYPKIFRFQMKLTGKEKKFQAGEYQLYKGMSHQELVHILTHGKVIRYRITIPEGLTFKEIGALLEEKKFFKKIDFINVAIDTSFMEELHVPAKNGEGFLFPSTYFISKEQTARDLIREMVNNFHSAYTQEIKNAAKNYNFSQIEVVTLASIIEKETGKAYERPLISSVFHNRLQKGMQLQTDPTVIYGIKNFNGNITRKDLRTPTPYNTYVIYGLPPGPIANPGQEALLAAVKPETSKFLYFVSKNDGSHIFSTNLKDHNRAVDQYQRKRQRKKKK